MDFSCCFYLSDGHGAVREDKENEGSRGDRTVGGASAKGTKEHTFGGHCCGVDIKHKTGEGHIQMREKSLKNELWGTPCLEVKVSECRFYY